MPLILGMIAGVGGPGKAQQADADSAPPAIKLAVHLRLGATTVGGLAAVIRDQTGLAIETDPSLAAHRIVVQLDGISAETALKTLAELNDWEITHPRAGHYRIGFRSIPLANHIADLPPAVQSALPMDFRRYLGVNTEVQTLSQDLYKASTFEQGRQLYMRTQDAKRDLAARSSMRIDAATRTLIESLTPLLADGREHPYADLPPHLKDALVTYLLIRQLKELNLNLLYNQLPTFQREPAKAELTLKEGIALRIGSTTQLNGGGIHGEGFGGTIKALTAPSDAPP